RWSSMVIHGFRRPHRVIDALQDMLRGWGGVRWLGLDSAGGASPEAFLYALQNADVIQVLARGMRDTLELTEPVSTAKLANFLQGDRVVIRARLVVIASCLVGHSFIAPLVEKGVTVIAARKILHLDVLIDFFSSFYHHLFPGKLAQGITLAEAYQKALS